LDGAAALARALRPRRAARSDAVAGLRRAGTHHPGAGSGIDQRGDPGRHLQPAAEAKRLCVLGEYSELKFQFVSQALVVQRSYLQQRGDQLENFLKAEIEGLAFVLAPKNKAAVIKALMRRMKTDATIAEEGYLDLIRGMERKPLPTVESMVHVQRLMKMQNPKVADVKLDDLIDGRIVKKLDDSGFIDRAYAAQGVSLK